MKINKKFKEVLFFGLLMLGGFLLFLTTNLFLLPAIKYPVLNARLQKIGSTDTTRLNEREIKMLIQTETQLNRRIEKLTPGSTFLIINTSENTFGLYRKNQLVRRGICSTGSLIHLEVDSIKSYLFETPKGALTVKSKITNPVWRKPDWAFIEEGLPVPPLNHPTRYEKNVLGDYALNLGNGYLIHGTLYQRLLGMPVTHGCIRLNDADLEAVYNAMNVGSKVFIY